MSRRTREGRGKGEEEEGTQDRRPTFTEVEIEEASSSDKPDVYDFSKMYHGCFRRSLKGV